MPRSHAYYHGSSRAPSPSARRRYHGHDNDGRSRSSYVTSSVPSSRRAGPRQSDWEHPQERLNRDRSHIYSSSAAPRSEASSTTAHPYEIEEPDGTSYDPRLDRQHDGGRRTSERHWTGSGRSNTRTHTASSRGRPARDPTPPPRPSRTYREPSSSARTRTDHSSRSSFTGSFTPVDPRTGRPIPREVGRTMYSRWVEEWESECDLDDEQWESDYHLDDDRYDSEPDFYDSGDEMEDRYMPARAGRQMRHGYMDRGQGPRSGGQANDRSGYVEIRTPRYR
ncbi:MAG: hypothetical protein M1831_003604 [Alyxoria varia]|nr:MAG: hypothetical protein M1831_003604 [Alyxoria varia]